MTYHAGPWSAEEVAALVALAKDAQLKIPDQVMIGYMLESYRFLAIRAEEAIHRLTK